MLQVILTSLDLISVAVPPALPLVLTVGIVLSVKRLHTESFASNPERINFAGRIDTMCWDKTGTLTSSELTFAGSNAAQKSETGREFGTLQNGEPILRDLKLCVSACHGLNTVDGQLIGHPLDIEMFSTSPRHLKQDISTLILDNGDSIPLIATIKSSSHHGSVEDIHIIKRFDFDSHVNAQPYKYWNLNMATLTSF